MTSWADVVTTALMGTERRPVVIDLDILDGVDTGPPEATLLLAAGVLAAYRRAGARPGTAGVAAAPAPDDPRHVASDTASQLLELLLGGDVRVPGGPGPLVAEWFERSASAGRRLPPKLVPMALDAATANGDLQTAIEAAAGPLERWLAERNAAWAWLAAGPPPGNDGAIDWDTASTAQRIEMIEAFRTTNPERAQTLIDDAWATEPAGTREAILKVVGATLTADDEALLERALDDRAKGVRQQAAALLDRLPTSERARRMATRLASLVSIGGRIRKGLSVELPTDDEIDAAARRDGITDVRVDGFGTAAGWLVQMVTATPLGWWSEHLEHDLDWIIDHGRDHKELLAGWTAAATRQRDARWAAALSKVAPRPELLATVAADDQRAAEMLLRASLPDLADAALFPMFAALPGGWSTDLSAAILDRYIRLAPKAPLLEMVAPVLAKRLDPSVASAVERWAAALPEASRDRRIARELHHALTIRRTIAEELR